MTLPADRPTRVRYGVMAFICSLAFLSYLDRVCISRAQQDIRHDLGISVAQMGFVMGIFWLGYAVFELPGGWLGDRFGARSTLSRIVLAWSLFTGLTGAAVGFTSLWVCRLLFGFGEAGAFPNMARVQSRWLPAGSRARAGGIMWLAARWGGAFSFLVFGKLMSGFDSPSFRQALRKTPVLAPLASLPAWRLGFWAMALVGVVWVLLFFFWFRDDPAQKTSVNEAELELIRADSAAPGESQTSPPVGGRMWAALICCGSLWAISVGHLCTSFGWSFFVSWMPQYLFDAHQISFKGSQAMDVLPLFVGGIACVVGGVLSDALVRWTGWTRAGRAIFPIAGYVTAASAMFALRLTHTPGQAIALMCVASAANDLGQGAAWAAIIQIGGLYAGTAFGFMNMVGNVGNFLQPPIGAMVFHRFGWNALLAVYASVYLVAAGMWLRIDPRRTFYRAAETTGFPVVIAAANLGR